MEVTKKLLATSIFIVGLNKKIHFLFSLIISLFTVDITC